MAPSGDIFRKAQSVRKELGSLEDMLRGTPQYDSLRRIVGDYDRFLSGLTNVEPASATLEVKTNELKREYSIDGIFKLKTVEEVGNYLNELKARGLIVDGQIGEPVRLRDSREIYGFYPLRDDSIHTRLLCAMIDLPNSDYKLLIPFNRVGTVPSPVFEMYYNIPEEVRVTKQMVSPTRIKKIEYSDNIMIFEIVSKGRIN